MAKPMSQGDFARLVRGGTLDLTDVELLLLRMSSQARSAAKRVHSESPERARTYLHNALMADFGGPAEATARSYLALLDRYITWDSAAGPAEPGVQPVISFAPDGAIRGRADMVFDLGDGRFMGRLLLWDDLPMDRRAAEIIALPCLRAVESRYGTGAVPHVEVWQLGTRQRERIKASDAIARDAEVHEILSKA